MNQRRTGFWQRTTQPGSDASTAGGVFLSFGAPTVAVLGLLGLILGDRLIGGVMFVVGTALAVFGHWLAGR